MSSALTPVLVAIIAGPIMWFLARLDRNNTKQHGQSIEVLKRVETKVDRLDSKTDHLDSKVLHIDKKILHVDKKIDDVHDRVASLEVKKTSPKSPRTK